MVNNLSFLLYDHLFNVFVIYRCKVATSGALEVFPNIYLVSQLRVEN